MPKKQPVCIHSVPVKVSLDELATELVRRFPEDDLNDALLSAALVADKRIRTSFPDRHNQYKATLLFRRLAERLLNPSDELALAVGRKSAEELKAKANEDQPKPRVKAKETAPASPAKLTLVPDEPVDEFASLIDIPTFEDFEYVFTKYPYVKDHLDKKRNERLLVLGYASGRDSDDSVIIRNCVLVAPGEPAMAKGTSFKDIGSIVGLLRRRKKGIHQTIKVVPYRVGAKVRTWHHVKDGSGDKAEWTRHFILTEEGLQKVGSRPEWDNYVYVPKAALN